MQRVNEFGLDRCTQSDTGQAIRPRPHHGRRLLTWVLAIALIMQGALLPGAVHAQGTTTGAVDDAQAFAECEALSEDELRAELNRITQSIFSDATAGPDVTGAVEQAWRAHDLDRVVDQAVDDAVAQVRQDDPLLQTFLSGWSPAKAEELSRLVAERAFGAEELRLALEALSADLAVAIDADLQRLTAESVSVNLVCLQEFIDRNYSAAVVAAFQNAIRDDVGGVDFAPDDELDGGLATVIDLHKSALGGVGVIIAAQVTKRVVQRMGRTISRRVAGRLAGRLVGRVGATVIPLAGWVVGTGLIVYDVLDSLDGALPQIQESLKAPEVKAAIRDEIVDAVEPELAREMPQLAREVANELYSQWLEFRRQYRQVLTLAAEDPAFAALLEASDDLGKVALLVDAILLGVGPAALESAMAQGQLARALDLPASSYAVIGATGSLDALFAWADLAGNRLDDVVALELYKSKAPADFSGAQLADLLAVTDEVAVAKLALLEGPALTEVLTLSSATVRELATALSVDELAWLAGVLPDLAGEQRNRLVALLIANPAAVDALQQRGATQALSAGIAPATVAGFLDTPADPATLASDTLELATSRISWSLFVAKYGWVVAGAVVAVPLLLLFSLAYTLAGIIFRPFIDLWRLVVGRRRRS